MTTGRVSECPSCPRWRPYAADWRTGSRDARSPRSRCGIRGRCGAMSLARTTSPPCSSAGPSREYAGGASTSGFRWIRPTRSWGTWGCRARCCCSRRRPKPGPHLRIRFRFTDDGPELRFVDQRTFGGLAVSPGGADLPREIAHIAYDPFEASFDPAAFVAALRRRRTGTKRALLDQTLISGVGNIYADEALWRAGWHGGRPAALSDPAGGAEVARARHRRHGGGDRGRRYEL